VRGHFFGKGGARISLRISQEEGGGRGKSTTSSASIHRRGGKKREWDSPLKKKREKGKEKFSHTSASIVTAIKVLFSPIDERKGRKGGPPLTSTGSGEGNDSSRIFQACMKKRQRGDPAVTQHPSYPYSSKEEGAGPMPPISSGKGIGRRGKKRGKRLSLCI